MEELWNQIKFCLDSKGFSLLVGFKDGGLAYDRDRNELAMFAIRFHEGMAWAFDPDAVPVGKDPVEDDALDEVYEKHIPSFSIEEIVPAIMQSIRFVLDEVPVYGIDLMEGGKNKEGKVVAAIAFSGPIKGGDADADD